MEIEVPLHLFSLNGMIKKRLTVLIIVILKYHVVQNDAIYHDIIDSLQFLLPVRILYNLPSSLDNSICLIYIFVGICLHFGVVFLLLTFGFMYCCRK
jgi:hypothetical protein